MRLFIALDIPPEIRARLTEYMERARVLAPEARWARVEGLHVTLKFIGHVDDAEVEKIKTALAPIKAAPFEVKFDRRGILSQSKRSAGLLGWSRRRRPVCRVWRQQLTPQWKNWASREKPSHTIRTSLWRGRVRVPCASYVRCWLIRRHSSVQ